MFITITTNICTEVTGATPIMAERCQGPGVFGQYDTIFCVVCESPVQIAIYILA